MRRLKRLALALIALVVVAVVGAVVYVSGIDFNAYRATIAQEAKAATGRDLAIRGDIDVSVISLSPTAVIEDVSFGNAGWGSRQEMVRLGRLEVKIALLPLLFGNLVIDRLVLIEPDILLETDKQGRGNWIFDAKDAPAPADGAADADGDAGGALPAVKSVRVERARIAYRDGRTGQTMAVTLGRVTLRADGADSPVELRAEGEVNGTAVEVDGTLGPIAQLLGGKAFPAALEIRIGGSDLSAKLNLRPASVPPVIKGTIDSRRLDIAEVAALAGAGPGAGAPPSDSGTGKPDDGRLFSDAKLPLDGLRALDADLRVTAGQLIAGGAEIADFQATLALSGGRLSIDSFAGKVAGGEFGGRVVLDAGKSPPRLSASVEARRIALGPLSRALMGSELVTAPLNLDLIVEGSGASPRAIAASLSGRATAVAGRGKVNDAVFDLLSADLLSAMTSWAGKDSGVVLSCAVADFTIAKGVALRRVLLVDTSRAAVVGRKGGRVDLVKERIDLLLDPYTKGISVASAVAVPIRVRGPLASVEVLPDPAETLKGAVMAPFNLVEKAGSGVLGAVGDAAGAVGSAVGLGGGSRQAIDAPEGPCPEALAAVESGQPWPGAKSAARTGDGGAAGEEEPGGVGKVLEDVGEGVGGAIDSIRKGIGNIFR